MGRVARVIGESKETGRQRKLLINLKTFPIAGTRILEERRSVKASSKRDSFFRGFVWEKNLRCTVGNKKS